MSGVILIPYSTIWPAAFHVVRAELLSIFAGAAVVVEHIGSTSVPGLSAKPVLDVMLGASSLADIEKRIAVLASAGYEYRRSYEQSIPARRYFVRAGSGAMRVHLHAVVKGHMIWQDYLHVRESLRGNLSLREEYQALKSSLAREFHGNKDAYTAAKAPFIQRVLSTNRVDAA
jgi:GrpB-like predicted nucleotidyltransferase (UPF0157 family)